MDIRISTPRPMPQRSPARSVQVMSTATKTSPADGLRVSDANRDRAIAELSEHFQAGRITADEFEDRTGRALAARTAADLAGLFTDLPRQQPTPPAAPAPAAPAPAAQGSGRPVRPQAAPIAIIAIVIAAAIISGHPGLIALVPVVALIIVRRLTCATRRHRG
jgi:DUF1707 SHOCT-like domain